MLLHYRLYSFSFQKFKTSLSFPTRSYSKIAPRRVTVNGAISPQTKDFFYVDPAEKNEEILLPSIRSGSYIMLHGPRASGKSSRVYRSIEQLQGEFVCLSTTFQTGVDFREYDKFWTSFGKTLTLRNDHVTLPSISSAINFAELMSKNNRDKLFCGKNTVLYVDEFDELYKAPQDVLDSFMNVLRGIKQERNSYCLQSFVAVGPFSILQLTGKSSSPFNVCDAVKSPNWDLKDVQNLFAQIGEERGIIFDEKIIVDIYVRTSGHAGLVCLCAKVIDEQLLSHKSTVSYDEWLQFATYNLTAAMKRWPTMSKIVDTLSLPEKEVKSSVEEKITPLIIESRKLIYTHFLPNSLKPIFLDSIEERLGKFLAAEGVLVPAPEPPQFKIPSPAMHSLLMTEMVPLLQHPRPNIPVPFKNGSLDVIQLIKQSIQFFNRDIMVDAPRLLFKQCRVVGTYNWKFVPQEDVYHTELFATLRGWLSTRSVRVISHPNSGTTPIEGVTTAEKKSEAAKRTDLILDLGRTQILIEIVASETTAKVEEHFQRAARDAKALGAQEAWVIHFTVVEESEGYKYPIVDPTKQVHVLHVWHDINFSHAKLVYESREGNCDVEWIKLINA